MKFWIIYELEELTGYDYISDIFFSMQEALKHQAKRRYRSTVQEISIDSDYLLFTLLANSKKSELDIPEKIWGKFIFDMIYRRDPMVKFGKTIYNNRN